ncbi:hypothetical protein [Streptomyces sp. NPDC003006]
MTEGAAFVRSGRMDLLATNRLARAFYHDVGLRPASVRRGPGDGRRTGPDPHHPRRRTQLPIGRITEPPRLVGSDPKLPPGRLTGRGLVQSERHLTAGRGS